MAPDLPMGGTEIPESSTKFGAPGHELWFSFSFQKHALIMLLVLKKNAEARLFSPSPQSAGTAPSPRAPSLQVCSTLGLLPAAFEGQPARDCW